MKELDYAFMMARAKALSDGEQTPSAPISQSTVDALRVAIQRSAKGKVGKSYVGEEYLGDVILAYSSALGAIGPKRGRPKKKGPGRPQDQGKKLLVYYLSKIFEQATGEELPKREDSRFGAFVREVGRAVGFGDMSGHVREISEIGPTKLLGLKSSEQIPAFCVEIHDEIHAKYLQAVAEAAIREIKSATDTNFEISEKAIKITRK